MRRWSVQTEDQGEGPVEVGQLGGAEPTGELAEPGLCVPGRRLFDQHGGVPSRVTLGRKSVGSALVEVGETSTAESSRWSDWTTTP